MSYIANQYNYATPLSSATGFVGGLSDIEDLKFFTLSDNVLDGTYHPASGDVGLWGTSVSGNDGTLQEPFVVTVTESIAANALLIRGSQYNYPVAFTVELYNNGQLLYAIAEEANSIHVYVHYFPATLTITHYVIRVTRISGGNMTARLYSVCNPDHVKRADAIPVLLGEHSESSLRIDRHRTDRLVVTHNDSVHITNRINVTHDALAVQVTEVPVLTNVHTRMKEASRRIYGKVYVTYTDPMLANETSIDTNMEAYNSNKDQLIDGVMSSNERLFTLYDNDLTGAYSVISDMSQVGWVSSAISDASGLFDDAPYLHISFSSRPITPLTVYFDDSHGSVAEDFEVEFVHADGNSAYVSFTGNTQASVLINEALLADVIAIAIRVTKVTKPGYPVAILEVPVLSTILYKGYQDESDLVSIDLLEELTYDDEVEALGGMSANEVTVVLDNSDGSFYYNSLSVVAGQLKRNRKIEPWLGVEVVPGEIEWHKLGTFWSYKWNVPVNGLVATAVGFDTIGLLDTTDFTEHHVLINKSFGELVEYVLADAKKSLGFLEWKIEPSLYETIVPYAWFENGSHTAALRKISQAYPMHIYCDRDGAICAAPQKLKFDYYYDTWSDSTNVISKTYDSLYTVLPNIVNVTVHIPQLTTDTLVQDNLVFDVAKVPTRTLNFNAPYVSDLVINVDKDDTVSYDYKVYSWGVTFMFTGVGSVRSITCSGTALDMSNTSTLFRKNAESVRLDGAVTRDVSADFIQTSELATFIIDRIFALSVQDKYDANVVYRGDIALSINDPIHLLDGIAPDTRYNIRRHKLTWNGALSGTADLNT